MDKPKLLETDSDIYNILPSELNANIKPSSDYEELENSMKNKILFLTCNNWDASSALNNLNACFLDGTK
jgi:hypothetical protein